MPIVVGFLVLAIVLIFLLNTNRWKRLGQGARGVKRELEDELHRDERR